MTVELTSHGPAFAFAVGWPGRPSMMTVVVRVVSRVEGATALPIAGGASPRPHPSLIAARAAEQVLFKQACEVGIVGREADETREVRTLELTLPSSTGAATSVARVVAPVGRSLAPIALPAAGWMDAPPVVPVDQTFHSPPLPLRITYARRDLACDVTITGPAPACWVRAVGRTSSVNLVLDGLWLDPHEGLLECTFRGAAFVPGAAPSADFALLVLATPAAEREALLHAFAADDAVASEGTEGEQEIGSTTVALDGGDGRSDTVTFEGVTGAPIGAPALPFAPAPRSVPSPAPPGPTAPPAWAPRPATYGHASDDPAPAIASGARPLLDPSELHRRVQRALWSGVDDVDALLASHGLDEVTWRALKRRVARRG